MMRQTLDAGLPELGLDLPESARQTLCDFGAAVIKQNEVMNLTAITQPDQVAKLHLLDSLTVLTAADLRGKQIIDVGCGAGFPGVPLAIACPEARVTLLDSLGKRMKWLEEILPQLGVRAQCVTARAEEAAAERRESYDYAVSRAVARLNILLELTAPYVKVGGAVLAMKGSAAREELAECTSAIKKLGLKLESVKEFSIDGASHAVIVLRKEATVRSLDVIVPIMAGCYFVMTLWIILTHLPQMPGVFARIFSEAFGLRQAVGGGFGAVVMNGIKRGLFSNEAGSGSAPCAAAAAECDDPVKMGLVQALGVLIDTIVICSCTAFVMLLAPESVTSGLQGMNLLQAAMQYHLGSFGVVFIAVTLALFSFSTFIGILYYARCNVAYLFGDRWLWQTAYKVLALVMLVVGGMEAYTVVWDLGDVGIGLMTIFNMLALYPLSGEALTALREYEAKKKLK